MSQPTSCVHVFEILVSAIMFILRIYVGLCHIYTRIHLGTLKTNNKTCFVQIYGSMASGDKQTTKMHPFKNLNPEISPKLPKILGREAH